MKTGWVHPGTDPKPYFTLETKAVDARSLSIFRQSGWRGNMSRSMMSGVALAFGAALLVGACGSDDTTRSTTTTTTTTSPNYGSTLTTPPVSGSTTTERSTTTKTE